MVLPVTSVAKCTRITGIIVMHVLDYCMLTLCTWMLWCLMASLVVPMWERCCFQGLGYMAGPIYGHAYGTCWKWHRYHETNCASHALNGTSEKQQTELAKVVYLSLCHWIWAVKVACTCTVKLGRGRCDQIEDKLKHYWYLYYVYATCSRCTVVTLSLWHN